MHRLNHSDVQIEIVRELTKTEESKDMTSEQVLAWAKRMDPQKTHSAFINSLNEYKNTLIW